MKQINTWQLDTKIEDVLTTYVEDVHALLCARLEWLDIDESYFSDHSLAQLEQDNRTLYEPLLKYDTSYANPDYASEYLPKAFAPICCAYYYEVCQMVPFIFQKRLDVIQKIVSKFYLISDILQHKKDIQALQDFEKEHVAIDMNDQIIQTYDVMNFTTTLHQSIDFQDLRYLYRYGIYITNQEMAFAQIMKNYSTEEIHVLANQMVSGYQKGFDVRNKKKSSRNIARIVQIVGLERIAHEIINLLKNAKQIGMVGDLVYQGIDPQMIFDHRHDDALYNSKAYCEAKKVAYEKALQHKDIALYQGNVIMVAFGQPKLDTLKKATAIAYADEQMDVIKKLEMDMKQILEQYIPKAEISFTGMAFPVEMIHSNYELIFKHIMQINMMDSKRHEEMQELLIHALDQGEYVEIKGYQGNETNIKVYLPKLQDPVSQTNFVNCGADINIPVGEVYTSPQLKHTEGLLHIRQARISKIAFQDIRIQFKDGFVSEYSCQNTADEKVNHELMEENIFHYRKTLPIGEFAIGTNTYAYTLAKEDGILYKLHTLIFEKLGPHIAIGDTCFAWSEENRLSSMFSGKEMMAKDNEVSMKRKEDITKAYMGVHYDLTIPYDDIGSIIVHKANHESITLIEKGRFVLAGCEELNLPLDGK